MKKTIFCLILFNPFFLFTQNTTYDKCDSIFGIAKTNYLKAKDLFISLDKKYLVEPSQKISFLRYSFDNKDYIFLKEQIKILIEKNGFSIQQVNLNSYNFYSTLASGELSEWYKDTFKNYYPIWLKKNIGKMEAIKIIDNLYIQDQLLSSFDKFSTDSSCLQSKQFSTMIAQEDFQHLEEIVDLSKKNGGLPNGFEYTTDIYQKIQLILLHNLKTKENFSKAWALIFPYLEKAYFDGKISYSFLYAYDAYSNMHFGHQYYGFLDKVPVKDSEGLSERKKRYKLQ